MRVSKRPFTLEMRKLFDEMEIDDLSPIIAKWIYMAAWQKFNFIYTDEHLACEILRKCVSRRSSLYSGFNATLAFVDMRPAGTTIEIQGEEIQKCSRADFLSTAMGYKGDTRTTFMSRFAAMRDADIPVGNDEYYLLAITIDPSYRGLGIGKQLLQNYIERGRSIGYKKLRLDVRTDNNPAMQLYISSGFKQIQEVHLNCLGFSVSGMLLEV